MMPWARAADESKITQPPFPSVPHLVDTTQHCDFAHILISTSLSDLFIPVVDSNLVVDLLTRRIPAKHHELVSKALNDKWCIWLSIFFRDHWRSPCGIDQETHRHQDPEEFYVKQDRIGMCIIKHRFTLGTTPDICFLKARDHLGRSIRGSSLLPPERFDLTAWL